MPMRLFTDAVADAVMCSIAGVGAMVAQVPEMSAPERWTALAALVAIALFVVLRIGPQIIAANAKQSKEFGDAIDRIVTRHEACLDKIAAAHRDDVRELMDRHELQLKVIASRCPIEDRRP